MATPTLRNSEGRDNFPNCDHDLITDPRGLYGSHYHSPTEDAIFDGDLENEKPQFDRPVNRPLSIKTESCAMRSTSMTEDIRQAGSLFSPPVDKTMDEKKPSERFPADAMLVCDEVLAAIPANSSGAQIAEDTQAIQDIKVTQNIGQLHERPEEQSGHEEPMDQIAETGLEKQHTTGSPDDDAGDIVPMSIPSQPNLPGSGSDYSSDYSSDNIRGSTGPSSTASSTLSLTKRRKNPNKRCHNDPPCTRKKNRQTNVEEHKTPAARDTGPPASGQAPPKDKTAGPAYSPANPKAAQSRQFQVPLRPLQPIPVNVLSPDYRKPQVLIETPPSRSKKPRTKKKEYTVEQKADQAACRKAGPCTECRQNKRKVSVLSSVFQYPVHQ